MVNMSIVNILFNVYAITIKWNTRNVEISVLIHCSAFNLSSQPLRQLLQRSSFLLCRCGYIRLHWPLLIPFPPLIQASNISAWCFQLQLLFCSVLDSKGTSLSITQLPSVCCWFFLDLIIFQQADRALPVILRKRRVIVKFTIKFFNFDRKREKYWTNSQEMLPGIPHHRAVALHTSVSLQQTALSCVVVNQKQPL